MNKLETIVLKNGLTIYLYPDSRRHSTLFQFITKFGGLSKDFIWNGKEYHFQDGIAHILEHYIVECNDCGNFLEILGEKQMSTNASTYYDMTRFYFETVEKVEEGISVLLQGIHSITFDTQKLEKLKNPIYQEIRGKSTNKFYHSNLMMMNQLFNHLSFRSIGGTLEEVEKTTVDDLRVCYEAFYQPKNQIIVIAGNYNRESVLETIQNFYDKQNTLDSNCTLLESHETVDIVKKEDTLLFPTSLDYVELSFKIDLASYSPMEQLNLDFYLHCFFQSFFGIVSPLHKKFIEKGIITSAIHCDELRLDHWLIVSIGAYTYDKTKFKKGILKTIQDGNSFSKEIFDLEKKATILRLILRDENIIDMILPFVDNVITYHYPYLDSVKDIQKLSYSDYEETIRKIDFSHYTIVTIQDTKKES